MVVPVGADEISIPFDDLIFGAPGSVVAVAQVNVEDELVGKNCDLAVLAENQASVHIGNDLIVSTGTSQAVILGVEDTPNGGTNQTYEMVVGDTITVHLRFGQDGMSSLGFGLSFDCRPEPGDPVTGGQTQETMTTTAAPTTTVPAPTTTRPPTTVAPPTVAGVVTNGGLPETPPARPVIGAPAYTG